MKERQNIKAERSRIVFNVKISFSSLFGPVGKNIENSLVPLFYGTDVTILSTSSSTNQKNASDGQACISIKKLKGKPF